MLVYSSEIKRRGPNVIGALDIDYVISLRGLI
jgi:hypothetical protein